VFSLVNGRGARREVPGAGLRGVEDACDDMNVRARHAAGPGPAAAGMRRNQTAPSATALLLLLCSGVCQAQYRGGSLHWEPAGAPGSRTVNFTLRTAWERSAGVYTKVVNGVPQKFEGAGMYQPVKGDTVKVLGPETPKVIISNGVWREYLELTVTSNTEQVRLGDPAGQNLPHEFPHWSYEGLNWFEGITQWEVELPDPHTTYVVEFQGCCRVNQMARPQNGGCIETAFGRGVLQLCETPFFLRTTVNLQHVPPPISFLPQMVTYNFLADDGTLGRPLVLPVLDYRATARGMAKIPPLDVVWPEHVGANEQEVRACT